MIVCVRSIYSSSESDTIESHCIRSLALLWRDVGGTACCTVTGTDSRYGVTNYGIASHQADLLTECIAIRLISESLVACLDRLFNRVSSHGAVVLRSVVGTPSPVGTVYQHNNRVAE